MESLQQTVVWLNSVLSDYVLTVLLIGCGVFFTIRTRFVQFRCFGEGIRNALGKFEGVKRQSGFSPFQSLMAAVAAQVGTGNIVGASGAILIGGPGAIFWMWVIAFFAMATIYAEAVLAQETKVTMPDGQVGGGPVYYIRKAFPRQARGLSRRILRCSDHPRARLCGLHGPGEFHQRHLQNRLRNPLMGNRGDTGGLFCADPDRRDETSDARHG